MTSLVEHVSAKINPVLDAAMEWVEAAIGQLPQRFAPKPPTIIRPGMNPAATAPVQIELADRVAFFAQIDCQSDDELDARRALALQFDRISPLPSDEVVTAMRPLDGSRWTVAIVERSTLSETRKNVAAGVQVDAYVATNPTGDAFTFRGTDEQSARRKRFGFLLGATAIFGLSISMFSGAIAQRAQEEYLTAQADRRTALSELRASSERLNQIANAPSPTGVVSSQTIAMLDALFMSKLEVAVVVNVHFEDNAMVAMIELPEQAVDGISAMSQSLTADPHFDGASTQIQGTINGLARVEIRAQFAGAGA
jgi:hypothetical protein